MDFRMHWQSEGTFHPLTHFSQGCLDRVPVRMMDHEAAQHEGMVLGVVATGVPAFVDVEQMHAWHIPIA
jgi:hypothetical protein